MRLLVAAFLAIATAISVNALYFQTPLPLAARDRGLVTQKAQAEEHSPSIRERARALITAALPGRHSAQPAVTAKEAEPQPTPLVKTLQKKLVQFGYKNLPQDGLPGRETRAAILAAEFEEGLPLTGMPSEAVLSGLFFLEASGHTRFGSSEHFERNTKLIKDVQDFLAKLGYGSGPVNGQLDAVTRSAIRRFESDRRLRGDGRLNERNLLEMVIEKGEPFLSKG